MVPFGPKLLQGMFLRNRDIFLHVHSTVLKIIKKLSLIQHRYLIYRLESDFANCPNNALYSRRKSQIMPFILLSYPFRILNLESGAVPLVSFCFFGFFFCGGESFKTVIFFDTYKPIIL